MTIPLLISLTRVRRLRAALALLLLSLVAACTPAPATDKRLRIIYATTSNIGDLTSLAANRTLRARGYDIVETFVANPELAVAALARGDAELAIGGASAYWVANHKGANLRMLISRSDNGYQLIAKPGLEHCADFHGRTLAVSTAGSLPTALLAAYLTSCPGIKPQVLSIPSSTDRMAALATGRIDAAILQRPDFWHLKQREPGGFVHVDDYERHVPPLHFIGAFATTAFIDTHRPLLLEWIREKIAADRRAQHDLPFLLEEAVHWPALAGTEPELMASEVAAGTWDPNGGLTPADVEETYQFFVRAGVVDDGLPATSLADLSLLEDALNGLGGRIAASGAGGAP